MGGGFKDIVKKERLDALERRQRAVEERLDARHVVITKQLGAIAKGVIEIQDAQEVFYDAFMARTWRGRFKRFVARIGGKG